MKKYLLWFVNVAAMFGNASIAYQIIRDLRKIESGFDLWINCFMVALWCLVVLVRWAGEFIA